MSKWISINKAAVKYGYNKAIIQLWAEMRRFPIDKCKRGITAEYIDTLEELCIEKTRICDIYVEIIGKQDKELMLQREKIAQISEIQATMKRQNVRLRDCKKIVSQYEKSFNVSWIERLWRRLKRLIK